MMLKIEDRGWRMEDRYYPSSILYLWCFLVPFRRLLVMMREAQNRRFVKVLADNLHADRHAVLIESTGQRECRHPRQIDRNRVDVGKIHLQRVLSFCAQVKRRRRGRWR